MMVVSIQTEDVPAPHFVLHRPDLRARANIHDILSDRTPLHYLRHLPLLKIPLRRVLHQRTLCARRRPRPLRALSSRACLSSRHRLAPRMHPRGPPTILRQPRRPFRRQVLHSLRYLRRRRHQRHPCRWNPWRHAQFFPCRNAGIARGQHGRRHVGKSQCEPRGNGVTGGRTCGGPTAPHRRSRYGRSDRQPRAEHGICTLSTTC
jgi:hypothetical protein